MTVPLASYRIGYQVVTNRIGGADEFSRAANEAWLHSLQQAMSPAEFAFRVLWLEILNPGHVWNAIYLAEMERRIFVTFCPGGYDGAPVCAVVTIEGSPPAGVFVVNLHGDRRVFVTMPGPRTIRHVSRSLQKALQDLVIERQLLGAWTPPA